MIEVRDTYDNAFSSHVGDGVVAAGISCPEKKSVAALCRKCFCCRESLAGVSTLGTDNLGIVISQSLSCFQEAQLYDTVYRMVHVVHTDGYGIL